MTYKPGSYMLGENELMVFVSDRNVLVFKGLSKPAMKSLALAKVEYMEFADGEILVEDAKPEPEKPDLR